MHWVSVRTPYRTTTTVQYPDTCLHFVGMFVFYGLSACSTVGI